MADKLYKVAGFTFTDEAGAKEALKEQKTIEYIESKTNMKDPRMINKVYHQIVDQNMFHTPVGFAYINKLKYLLEDIEDENKAVNNPKVATTKPVEKKDKPSMSKNSIRDGEAGNRGTSRGSSAKAVSLRNNGGKTTVRRKTSDSKGSNGVSVPVSERTVEALEECLETTNKEVAKYKGLTRLFIAVSASLAVCVLAMFYISSTMGSPTILNYEEEIINKYASWEQQLIERENAVLIKERALNNK